MSQAQQKKTIHEQSREQYDLIKNKSNLGWFVFSNKLNIGLKNKTHILLSLKLIRNWEHN